MVKNREHHSTRVFYLFNLCCSNLSFCEFVWVLATHEFVAQHKRWVIEVLSDGSSHWLSLDNNRVGSLAYICIWWL